MNCKRIGAMMIAVLLVLSMVFSFGQTAMAYEVAQDQDPVELIQAADNDGWITVRCDNGIADKSVFEALAGTNKTVLFECGDYTWRVNGADIRNSSVSVDLRVKIDIDNASSFGMEPTPVLVIEFPDNGTLPGKMELLFSTEDIRPGDDNETYCVTEDGLKKDDTSATVYKAEEDDFTSVIVRLSRKSKFIISENKLQKAMDTTSAVTVNSTQEAIDALKKTREKHLETVILRANPDKVKILNDDPYMADLHPSIYRAFDYSVTGGLYDFMNYDVVSGPTYYEYITDPNDSSYTYYKVQFEYSENDEELAAADSKLRQILKECEGKPDGDKVIYLCDWMKKNIAKEKDSDSGYERNCNGLYGCLFGDGTGFCCSTYAKTIQRFCELAGIESRIVSGGEGEISHAYNAIKIGSQWYLTDYTWGEIMRGWNYFKSKNYEPYVGFTKKYMSSYTLADKDYKSGSSGGGTTACSHSRIVVVPKKAAKCNETGYKKHWKCESCGQLFKDAKGKNKTTEKAVKVKTTAHKFKKKIATDEYLKSAATCTKKGTYYYACTMCGAKGKKTYTGGSLLPHDFTKVDKVEATCQHTGMKEHYKCSLCKKLYASQKAKKPTTAKKLTIKKLKHKFTAKVTEDKYKAKKAGEYYYSCPTCGKKGKKTFKAAVPAE